MICLGSHHWYVAVRALKLSLCGFFGVCDLHHVLYCLLRGPAEHRGSSAPLELLDDGSGCQNERPWRMAKEC